MTSVSARHAGPTVTGSPVEWSADRIGTVLDDLSRQGAVLVREAGIRSADDATAAVEALNLQAVTEIEPLARRERFGPTTYASLTWPAGSQMCMHHDGLLSPQPTEVLAVACLTAPDSGGETGLADGRRVMAAVPDRIAERAVAHGWRLTRRYADDLIGLPWQDAFGTADPEDALQRARTGGATAEWSGQTLVSQRVLPAVQGTDAPAWVNLMAFASEWTLDPAVHEYLVETVGRAGLPMATEYGDGSPLPLIEVKALEGAYDSVATTVTWRPGDLLLIDNMRTAHSRRAYTGTREMVVVHARWARDPRQADEGPVSRL